MSLTKGRCLLLLLGILGGYACGHRQPFSHAGLLNPAGAAAQRLVGPGTWKVFYPADKEPRQLPIAAFRLDQYPVTNADFLRFVRERPQWRRDRVSRAFADDGYLQAWPTPVVLRPGDETRPVVQVSWFAARAYCAWRGARLPSEREWEFAAQADETSADGTRNAAWQQEILGWYSRPNEQSLPPVGSRAANYWGVYDLHGLVWEWVEDFNGSLVSADNRNQDDRDKAAFCGAGSYNAAEKENYVTFMRMAMRGSLKGGSVTANLGFRCAADAEAAQSHGIYDFGADFIDQNGVDAKLSRYRGFPVLVAMFYANCPAVCPMLLANLQAFDRQLSAAQRPFVRYLLISMDAERDTPVALIEVAKRYGLDARRWTLLHGDQTQVRAVAALLDVKYRRMQDGEFQHTANVTLLNANGRPEAVFDGMRPLPAEAHESLSRLLPRR